MPTRQKRAAVAEEYIPFVLPVAEQPEPEVPTNPAAPYLFRVRTTAGDFVFRLSTIRDDVRAERLSEEIYGEPLPIFGPGETVPVYVTVARMLGEMATVCESAPAGFAWMQMRDHDKLFELWGGYKRQYAGFRQRVGGF
jgi:hypothetical protein